MDKLELNKKYIIFLIIFATFSLIFSCSFKEKKHPHSVEIVCPELEKKFLIPHFNSLEFWQAIDDFEKYKTENKITDANYTAVKFKNGQALQLKGMKSEDIKTKCLTRDVLLHEIEKEYRY